MASRATPNADKGTSIERYRAKERNGHHVPEAWFDVEAEDGTPVEVKSTQRRLASGRRGRFRFWQEQHENMEDHTGEYDLVVTEDDSTAFERTLSADEVSEVIEDAGISWTGAGDHHMGRQAKVPWSYFFEDAE